MEVERWVAVIGAEGGIHLFLFRFGVFSVSIQNLGLLVPYSSKQGYDSGGDMYLFFDTETTGLPRDWSAPVSDLSNWPRMVQIAWLLYDAGGARVSKKEYIIRPEGFSIPQEAAKIHGITTEKASAAGVYLRAVLEEFSAVMERARYLIAHNMRFDEKIVGAEFLREGVTHKLFEARKICTMTETTEYCKLPGNYGNKWPKLSELHFKLFNETFEEAHSAAVDVEICAKCFWELARRGILAAT